MINWLRARLRAERDRKVARAALDALFESPDNLAGTSLKPHHRKRTMLLEHEIVDDTTRWLRFSILRHPRPYKFSKQVHEVIEYYRYEDGTLTREGSVNASRLEGNDGQPSGKFGF